MDNREKAQSLIKVLERPFSGKFLVELLEAELNRLDAPEPKKWEPRGGIYYMDDSNMVKSGVRTEDCRLAGREYPTREEAETAAPMHRKLDRLVNWMIQYCPDVEEKELIIAESMLGNISITFSGTPGKVFKDIINSGVVEL